MSGAAGQAASAERARDRGADPGLSRKEEALWLFQRFAPHIGVDNQPLAIRTSAEIDPVVLAAATREVMRRHPALRTRFPARHGVPRRQVVDPDDVTPEVSCVEVPAARLAETLTMLARRPFDLTTDLPLRVTRIALREGGSVLCAVSHHIVYDGGSGGVVLPELATTYWRMSGGAARVERPDPPVLVEAPPSERSLRYWLDALDGVDLGRLAPDAARPEPAAPTFAGARFEHRLSPPAQASLRALRTGVRATDNMVLLAAYYLLLARHGAGPDLVVGVPVNLRRRATMGAVGYHINTLPVRVRVDLSRGFRQLTTQVRDRLVAGLAHADVSFESLLGQLRLGTPDWRAPLFRHMFNFLPPLAVAAPGELPDSSWVTVDPAMSRHDLQFVVLRSAGDIVLQAVYSTEIHDEAYVRSLVERYELLLRAAAEEPDRPLAELDMWSHRERAVVDRVNARATAVAPAPPVPRLISQRIVTAPAAPALIEPDGRVHSLQELAARAAGIRRALAGAGVERGCVVALTAPRGPELAAAVLAAWSLGAAYLPLDPAQPAGRMRDQLDVAAARALLTDDQPPPECAAGRHVVPLAQPSIADTGALTAGLAAVRADDLAYLIFTSGSTGRPKGVEIVHRGLAYLIRHFAQELRVTERSRVLWLTTFGFDISALELFLPLCHGGGAVVAPDEARARPDLLLDLITRHDAAIVQSTPTIWRLVAPRLGDQLRGRHVLCGGEPLPAALAQRLLRSGCTLSNVYGPTETTIWSTMARIGPETADPVGVGGPIGGTALYVMDDAGREVPPGVVGELCIAGAGVARGYAGQPELTGERFRADASRGRHYRTGDLAIWRPDGSVVLLGRADRQVKLRGRRIELGEIEAALQRHPAVAAAAVTVHGDPQGDGRLIGYLQPADPGRAPDLDEVGRYLRATLPYYLIPAQLLPLDSLPRSANGKVDYRALPEPAGFRRAEAEPVDPADPLVGEFVGIWREVLRRDDLGPHSNLFTSGGHSLLAAVVAARVGERTGCPVSLLDVFDAPTPAELTRLVRELDTRIGTGVDG
jgi:amino acid adenylation domain-containing protein